MHTDVWYDLVLQELTGTDPLSERLREAEAVQGPSAEPEVAEPEVVGEDEEPIG